MSDHNPSTWHQAFDLLCDEQLGVGMSRTVYSSRVVPDCVVKVEDISGFFQNVVEWETWQRVKDTPYSRWFAACRWISPSGVILVMERTRVAAPQEYPNKLPVFLCDTKRTNYGVTADSKFVCHDYGTNLLFEKGMSSRMSKAEWYDA